MNRRTIAADCVAALAAAGRQTNEILRYLRDQGYSMGESTVAVAEGLRIDLGVAQELVIENLVWADYRLVQAQAQESLWEALEQLGSSREDGSIEIDLSTFDDS